MERLKRPSSLPGPPSPPRIPRQRRAFSTLGGPVEVAGAPVEAGLLRGLFKVDPTLGRALTHGFHSYAGRLHPSIARGAVAALSAPGDAVVDPFCGSGTVLVEAMGLGRAATGIDASPLAVAIAGTRTDVLGEAGRADLVARALAAAELSGEAARKRRRPEIPAWARQETARFFPHVVLELLGLRAAVFAEADAASPAVGRALRLCFSSILVKLMKAGPEAPRDGASKRIARGVPSRLLSDRAQELAAGLAALDARAPKGTPPARVRLGDARALRGVPDGRAALVLSSPPYAGTYDYAAQHEVRFTWLELPRTGFGKTQIGNRAATGFGAEPSAWLASRRAWIAEMARVLRPGGHALLVVGDGVVGNAAEDAALAVEQAGRPVGLVAVARASQARPMHDRRLAAIFAGQPRREHLVLLRRGNAS